MSDTPQELQRRIDQKLSLLVGDSDGTPGLLDNIGTQNLTWQPTQATTVDTNGKDIIAASADTKYLIICNLSTSNQKLYVNVGRDASTTEAISIIHAELTGKVDGTLVQERVHAIASNGTIPIAYKVAT